MTGPGSGDPPDDSEPDDESSVDHRINDDPRGSESTRRADSGREPGGDDPESGGSSNPVPDAASRDSDGPTAASGDSDAPTAGSAAARGNEVSSSNAGAGRPTRNDGGESDDVRIDEDGLIRWFLGTDNGTVVVVRDVASSVGAVVLVGLLLFAVSGIWPPMVAVESGSMEPNMQRGDLVFVVEADRFVSDGAVDGTGIVTHRGAPDGHEKFGKPGDVIVFRPGGSDYRTPVIHRAHFWVEEGERWVGTKANDDFLNGATCDQIQTCPAPRDGFVTKGDANSGYDQARGGARTTVVSPEWVTGKAMFRIPLLGHVRLTFDAILATTPSGPTIGTDGDFDRAPGVVSATQATTRESSSIDDAAPSATARSTNPDPHPIGGIVVVGVTGTLLALSRRRFADRRRR